MTEHAIKFINFINGYKCDNTDNRYNREHNCVVIKCAYNADGCLQKMSTNTYSDETKYLQKINFLYLLTGFIALLWITSTQTVFREYSSFFTEPFSIIRSTFLAADVMIFVIAIFGFYAIFTEVYYLKLALVCAMMISFVFKLAVSIAIHQFLQGKTISLVQTQMNTTMGFYGGDMNYMYTKDWDSAQEAFSCCGVKSASDWLEYLNTEDTGQLPVSCCRRNYGTVGQFSCTVPESHVTGCANALGGWAESQLAVMGFVGVVSTMIQLLLTVFAFLRVKDRQVSQAKTDTEVIPEEVNKQVIYDEGCKY